MSSVVTSAQQWLAAVSFRRQLCKQLLLTSLQPIAAVMYGRECWSPILTSTTGLSTAGGPGVGAVKLTLMLVSVTGAGGGLKAQPLRKVTFKTFAWLQLDQF